jgi:hypothetical protein
MLINQPLSAGTALKTHVLPQYSPKTGSEKLTSSNLPPQASISPEAQLTFNYFVPGSHRSGRKFQFAAASP